MSPRRTDIDVVEVERRGLRELFATLKPGAGEGLASLFGRLGRLSAEREAGVLGMRIFGAAPAYPECRAAILEHFGRIRFPVTYIESAGPPAHPIAGIQLHAVIGAPLQILDLGGRTVDAVYEDDHARHCILGDLGAHDLSLPHAAQARQTLDSMEEALELAGMDLRDIVRTWFFINDILEWYPQFNSVRSELYAKRGLLDRYVPASTGIGGRAPDGRAIVANALALKAKRDDVSVNEVPSPLQASPGEYGSSFSRAAEVSTPGYRALFISGTASIDRDGTSTHVGDVDAQITRTLEVIGALLTSRGMEFSDVTRANAYFKRSEDVGRLGVSCRKFGLPMARVVTSQNEICRDELLFELEVDAVTSEGSV